MMSLSKKTIELFLLLTIVVVIALSIYVFSREPEPVAPEDSSPKNMELIRSNDDLNSATKELDETNIDDTIDLQLKQIASELTQS